MIMGNYILSGKYFHPTTDNTEASLVVAQTVKNLPAMQEAWV